MRKILNKKEMIFCYFFVETGNPKEALSFAKMENTSETLPKLMSDPLIKDQILKNYESKKINLGIKAEIGYERLAFNDISDCIKLMFIKDIENYQINKMNLFNISEIKRLKDGTMEIKFFDRIKALEKLQSIGSEQCEDDIYSFYSSLKKDNSASSRKKDEN